MKMYNLMIRKTVILLAMALLFTSVMTSSVHHQPRKEDMYTSRYDHFNLDEILKSERLLKNYFECLMDRGPCTADGAELKRNIPDALLTGCSKCTEKQKEGSRTVINHLREHKPDLWKQLEAKWDPKGEYIKRLHGEEHKKTTTKA